MLAPWLLFEAGVLAGRLEQGRLIPLLFGVSKAELRQPLAAFQSIDATRDGLRALLDSLHGVLAGGKATSAQLDEAFGAPWDELDRKIEAIMEREAEGSRPIRSERDMVEEVLLLVRNQRTITQQNGDAVEKMGEELKRICLWLPRPDHPLVRHASAIVEKEAHLRYLEDLEATVPDQAEASLARAIRLTSEEIQSLRPLVVEQANAIAPSGASQGTRA